jgi:hypothetical protein
MITVHSIAAILFSLVGTLVVLMLCGAIAQEVVDVVVLNALRAA